MPTIKELLDRSRRELLDLSTRNRLLSIPVKSKSARIIEIHDEVSEQIFKILINDKKSLSFLPGRASKKESKSDDSVEEDLFNEELSLPQPEDEDTDPSSGLPKRHIDTRLQTNLTPEGLQRRLLDLYYDAQTMIEEQGVNVLYLAIGHLKWFEAEHSDVPRYAPLILVPVELQRKSASERFHLRWREEDLQANLSLKAKLKADFGIEFPELSNEEDFSPNKYFEEVRKVIGNAEAWEILPNEMTLGFFSFAKFLMYRDLDPKNWPNEDMLLKHEFIAGLLQDGFPQSEQLFSDSTNIDDLITVSKLDHVVDADSSQTLAIEAVRQGRSIVVQGPPGTGKSQSITNIIATAVLDGKKVLFIAEKLAALEVVKRRLEAEGLGSLCLELHSNKSNKKNVIDEIARTWALGKPTAKNLESIASQLEEKRNLLNKHVKSLHEIYAPSGLTPFFIVGYLAALGDRGKETTVVFPDCEKWSSESRREARNLIGELKDRIGQIGQPSHHPWRGVCRETVLPMDLDPIAAKIKTLSEALTKLQDFVSLLANYLSLKIPTDFREIEQQKNIGEYVLRSPVVDRSALCNEIWNSGFNSLRELLAEGNKFTQAIKEFAGRTNGNIWEQDYSNHRQNIAPQGKSLLRFLNPKYIQSIREVRKGVRIKFTASCDEKTNLIDKIIVGQKALRYIRGNEPTGKLAFGSLWKSENSEWTQIQAVLDWVSQQQSIGLDTSFHQTFSKIKEQDQIAQLTSQISAQIVVCRNHVGELFHELKLDTLIALAAKEIDLVLLQELISRCSLWLAKMEELSRWNNYFVRASKARDSGLAELVAKMEIGEVKVQLALDVFDRSYFGQLLRAVVKQKPELAQFDGVLHDSHVSEFRKLDKDRLTLSKYRTLIKHHGGIPPGGAGIGPAGIVKSEMERKRGLRPVRKLLKDAGPVVQAIKPVFMMSPLSVAQFLEPGAVEFDLLVIDEASQVQPVDAFGAVARCKQLVVVGDSKQLPPTKFFSRLTTESVDEDEEATDVAEAKDIESILGLCCARGFSSSMLRWHYRSRHHSLIAVSNKEFYENELFIVPSPYSSTSSLGLRFNHIPEGVFDTGNTGTNRVEAKAVCRAIIEHARKTPNLSLGVAAFSVRQRQAILDELELLRRESPDTEFFFSNNSTEPFFVKNLENVQGDERDVIFISIGYGRDVNGFMAMRFGPLSNEGGERRLNVLISRAKQRCEVFSSITADDIDLERASGKGVAALKVFLTFAQTGRLSIAKLSGEDEQSPFEEAVRASIETLGYEVHPQVGIAGFFIDLAIVDKAGSGRYLLGVECDGASYHSSRSARDRDRLRQAVLEDHGWIIHRIWSIDWFQRPQEQLRKVAESIEKAKIALAEIKNLEKPSVSLTIEIDSEIIKRETKPDEVNLTVPYKEASFTVKRNLAPHEVSSKEMSEIICRIVDEEGPIHEDEILVRIRELWGLGRAGSRIQDVVTKSVRSVLVSRQCIREDGFLSKPGSKVLIRNRENVSSTSLRKPDMLPPTEIRAAILALIDLYHGSTREEIPIAVARLCGFKSTSSQLREVVDREVKRLLKGDVEEFNGMLRRRAS